MSNTILTMILTIFLIIVFQGMLVKIQMGTLKKNAFFGIRTPLTMKSENNWEIGHQAAVPAIKIVLAILYVFLFLSIANALMHFFNPMILSSTIAIVVFVGAIAMWWLARTAILKQK